MNNKKTYHKPKIIKVKVKIRNAILAACHSSANVTAYSEPTGCSFPSQGPCYSPPSGT